MTVCSMNCRNTRWLFKEIAAVNSNVIAVVMNGGAVAMPWADEVKAILECFYGGQGIGRAIVKVISGEVNPSGHMPVSVPAFREQIISDEILQSRRSR